MRNTTHREEGATLLMKKWLRKPSQPQKQTMLCGRWLVLLLLAALLSGGCTSPVSDAGRARSESASGPRAAARTGARPLPPTVAGEFTPRDCPPISDEATILATIMTCDSGAPWTQHPCVDLSVRDGTASYVLRMHFGDLGDGINACLPFDECKNMKPMPGATYPVETRVVKGLLAYLKDRQYCVGKFSSWGVPVLLPPARGSNCGDAFLEVVRRLGLASEALPAMSRWITANRKGKWAFEHGRRRPIDEFFNQAGPTNYRGAYSSLISDRKY